MDDTIGGLIFVLIVAPILIEKIGDWLISLLPF